MRPAGLKREEWDSVKPRIWTGVATVWKELLRAVAAARQVSLSELVSLERVGLCGLFSIEGAGTVVCESSL